MEFKVGDKVKRLKNPGEEKLEIGKIYIVESGGKGFMKVEGVECDFLNPENFELFKTPLIQTFTDEELEQEMKRRKRILLLEDSIIKNKTYNDAIIKKMEDELELLRNQ